MCRRWGLVHFERCRKLKNAGNRAGGLGSVGHLQCGNMWEGSRGIPDCWQYGADGGELKRENNFTGVEKLGERRRKRWRRGRIVRPRVLTAINWRGRHDSDPSALGEAGEKETWRAATAILFRKKKNGCEPWVGWLVHVAEHPQRARRTS